MLFCPGMPITGKTMQSSTSIQGVVATRPLNEYITFCLRPRGCDTLCLDLLPLWVGRGARLQRKSDLLELVNQTSSRLLAQTTTYWHQNQRRCLEKVPRPLSASTNLALSSENSPATSSNLLVELRQRFLLASFSHRMCRTLTEVAGFNLLSLPPFPLSFDDESSLLLSASFPFPLFEYLAAPFFLSGAIAIHSSMALSLQQKWRAALNPAAKLAV